MTADPIDVCPKCKGVPRRLISGGAGLLFKGSGFYITDYRSDKYKADKSKDSSAESSSSSSTPSSSDTKSKSKAKTEGKSDSKGS